MTKIIKRKTTLKFPASDDRGEQIVTTEPDNGNVILKVHSGNSEGKVRITWREALQLKNILAEAIEDAKNQQ